MLACVRHVYAERQIDFYRGSLCVIGCEATSQSVGHTAFAVLRFMEMPGAFQWLPSNLQRASFRIESSHMRSEKLMTEIDSTRALMASSFMNVSLH